jgi:hypothetical protein
MQYNALTDPHHQVNPKTINPYQKQYFQKDKNIEEMKKILETKAIVNTRENGGVFEKIGDLLGIVKDAQSDDIEDARVTKELFQKCQLLDLLILLMVFTGNMFCVLSVFEF